MSTDRRILELESAMAELQASKRRSGWRTRWAAIGAAVAITVGGGGTALHYASAAPVTGTQNSFVSVTPIRILNSRPGVDNVGGFVGPLTAGQIHTFQVAGVNGVPANATAVVLNVTAADTTAQSHFRVFPAGTAPPTVSNLNWKPNTNIANLTTVKVGAGGQISVYNQAGTANVIADLAGYYVAGNDKFINIDILGHPGDTATSNRGFGANSGLGFADGVNNLASFHVVLPPDYTPGGAILGKFTWHTSAISCAVSWRVDSVSVSRAGATHNQFGSASTGMSEPGVSAAGPTANLVQATTFTLTSPNPAITLQPGDSYTFTMFRSGPTAADTCGALAKIDSMVIIYE